MRMYAVRRVDSLGRFSLPAKLRRNLDINDKDVLEVFTDDDKIVLRKYKPACVFCGVDDEVTKVKGKTVCKTCLAGMSQKVV